MIMIALWFVVVVVVIAVGVIPPRLRMEQRARALLATYPDAEQTSFYLPFHSRWARAKRAEMEAKIAEMEANDWIFLRAREASPLRTLRTAGGGLTMQFIKVPGGEKL